ncbi:hypothetical protein HAX54_025823 [Datura stramonium]|uniref:Uncharacterized protein n=1 Tax=Datura stramonium TaxID=4076 RepID=A0ABS8V332_DATST|nr:hypothetical protein [Datura stramonium]
MGEFLAISQSSIVLPHFRVQAWSQRQHFIARSQPLRSLHSSLHPLTTTPTVYPDLSTRSKHFYWGIRASVVSDSTMPTTFTVDSAGPGIDILPETDEGKDHNSKKKMALSMSQKLTLGYAFLVGAGGFMGYLKSGSTKSLIAGGASAALLYSVYAMLPTQPVLASAIGFVLSAGLLGVMGSRFLKSKKIFPAGVVSFVSLVMTGGYLHGILRSPNPTYKEELDIFGVAIDKGLECNDYVDEDIGINSDGNVVNGANFLDLNGVDTDLPSSESDRDVIPGENGSNVDEELRSSMVKRRNKRIIILGGKKGFPKKYQ